MKQFFTENTLQKEAFLAFFSSPRKVVITSHMNPDGDAFGSSLGLYHVLIKQGHDVKVISPTDHAAFLSWMPGVPDVMNFEGKEQQRALELIQNAELICCLDFSALGRIRDMEEPVREAQGLKLLVDHHQEPEQFADYVFWNDKSAATCELLFQMFEELGWSDLVEKDAATCLYTGILTDTGSFRFDSTTSEIHRIAGGLIDKGVNPGWVHRQLFDNQKIDRLKFLGYGLSEKLKVLPEYRLAYFIISKEELEQFNSQKGDTDGMVNYGLSIEGVIFSAIFIEKDGIVKISFRSVDDFSVSEFSRKHFQGGGHKNAAGGKSDLSLEETEKYFLNLLPQYQSQLLEQPA